MNVLEKTDRKHTSLPWEAQRMRIPQYEKDRRCGFVINGPDADPLPIRICDMRAPSGLDGFEVVRANAEFIEIACNNYYELLAALEELTSEVKLRNLNVRKDFSLINAHACATKAIHKAKLKTKVPDSCTEL